MRAHIIAIADTENQQQPRRNDRRALGQHAGQLLQRFFADSMRDPRTGTKRDKHDPEEPKALFRAAIAACRSESVQTLYKAAYARWIDSFSKSGTHASMKLATTSRLSVGLGSENVLEAGLRLHHTYGTPIIPGSALKGVVSHYCHDVWGQRHDTAASKENRQFQRGGGYHSLLFGTTDDGGVITFHDAWILPESLKEGALHHDVMTPHHPKWQTNEAPPTDFDSPVPVSFLSVVGTFDVRLTWSGAAVAPPDQAAAWTGLAMQILREALAERGVGGKTSSGYGRLVPADHSGNARQTSVSGATERPSATSPERTARPTANEKVRALLLEKRTRKGGWMALHKPSGLSGDIQNSAAVPADRKPGDTLDLFIAFATERAIAFAYPTPEEEARRAAGKERGRARKGGRRK